jgi:hypothetical protein
MSSHLFEGLVIPKIGSIWRPLRLDDDQYVKVLDYANGHVTVERHRRKTMSLRSFHRDYAFDRETA